MQATKTFTADGNSDWYRAHGAVKVSAVFQSGTGTLTAQQFMVDSVESILDETGSAISGTASFDWVLDLKADDAFRINLASSSTPDIDLKITGDFEKIAVVVP